MQRAIEIRDALLHAAARIPDHDLRGRRLHDLDRDIATIGERAERDRLAGELREHGIRLAAVNGAGNLLHPDPAKRKDAQARFRAAVELAVALGVKRVVTMSGCPAGAGGGALSIFPCWATSADDERIFDWQMENEVGPFWRQTSDWLAKEAPEVMAERVASEKPLRPAMTAAPTYTSARGVVSMSAPASSSAEPPAWASCARNSRRRRS